jgi:hypothetical protein
MTRKAISNGWKPVSKAIIAYSGSLAGTIGLFLWIRSVGRPLGELSGDAVKPVGRQSVGTYGILIPVLLVVLVGSRTLRDWFLLRFDYRRGIGREIRRKPLRRTLARLRPSRIGSYRHSAQRAGFYGTHCTQCRP